MERKGRVGEVGRVLCFTKFHTPHHRCCSTLTTVQSVPGCSCHIIHTPHFMCSTLSELYDQFLAMEAEVHNEMLESITFIVDLRRFCFRAVQIMQVRGEGGGKIYFWIQGLFKIDTSTLGRDGAHCAALLHSTFLPLHLLCTQESLAAIASSFDLSAPIALKLPPPTPVGGVKPPQVGEERSRAW